MRYIPAWEKVNGYAQYIEHVEWIIIYGFDITKRWINARKWLLWMQLNPKMCGRRKLVCSHKSPLLTSSIFLSYDPVMVHFRSYIGHYKMSTIKLWLSWMQFHPTRYDETCGISLTQITSSHIKYFYCMIYDGAF